MWRFHKNKTENREIRKETEDLSHIDNNDLDKACFQHNIAYGNKDLPSRTAEDKVLGDKAFAITQDQSEDGYQSSLATMVLVHIFGQTWHFLLKV